MVGRYPEDGDPKPDPDSTARRTGTQAGALVAGARGTSESLATAPSAVRCGEQGVGGDQSRSDGPVEKLSKELAMGAGDKAENKAEELKGKVKEGVGDATDNEQLQAEGRADQASSNLKQAGEDVKDAIRD